MASGNGIERVEMNVFAMKRRREANDVKSGEEEEGGGKNGVKGRKGENKADEQKKRKAQDPTYKKNKSTDGRWIHFFFLCPTR